ncbi:MAG: ATP-binding cassette domain-containing protein [Firmicutes bacterium]|nr:ATP-binding cassette domain-containing protein [Bacillota bacterium]
MKIEVRNVTKKFQQEVVIDDISLDLEPGIIYGFIGRNGSGKSVFLKLLCALYEPTKGEILFDGMNVIKKKLFPPKTGALIEKPTFLPDLTGFENLKLLASIQNKVPDEKILEMLKKVNLYDAKDKKYKKYSLGMKQKLGIVQALMEDPEVIILDEPFNGVEEGTVLQIRKLLLEEKKRGKLIIIATHIKEDISELADIVYVFEQGKIIQK